MIIITDEKYWISFKGVNTCVCTHVVVWQFCTQIFSARFFELILAQFWVTSDFKGIDEDGLNLGCYYGDFHQYVVRSSMLVYSQKGFEL